jgi:hypothetical protein
MATWKKVMIGTTVGAAVIVGGYNYVEKEARTDLNTAITMAELFNDYRGLEAQGFIRGEKCEPDKILTKKLLDDELLIEGYDIPFAVKCEDKKQFIKEERIKSDATQDGFSLDSECHTSGESCKCASSKRCVRQ